MIIPAAIILLYFSFVLELVIWPVPSEASTGHLLKEWKSNGTLRNVMYIFMYIINFFFTLSPLIISLYSLFHTDLIQSDLISIGGLILAWSGRAISMYGAFLLHKNRRVNLLTGKIFRWSRNPISLGLFLTFLGLLMIIPYPLLIAAYVGFIVIINFKINIEEKFLNAKFGSEYQRYKKSTPKYFIL